MPNPLQSGSESAQMEALPLSAANNPIGPSQPLHSYGSSKFENAKIKLYEPI